ncbi:MAG: transposase [Dysgonamonadaceae bacterium]|jgi:hypothetical protein|nr:transposase [Dysgonamonadaceae bacterium]
MVFDHVGHRMRLGFKMLFALYFDSISSIPLYFSLLSEKGKREDKPFGMRQKDLRRQFSKKRLKESEGASRINELTASKIELVIRIFFRMVYHCITVDCVLCDSWFTCDDLITAVRSQKCHLIGMYKFVKTKFEFKDKLFSYIEILHLTGKAKRCKKMNLYYKTARVIYKGEPVTLFFSKIGHGGDWKVILFTDTKLSFLQAIEIYQIRWSIEVFFKDVKQLLNIGCCQSINFDAQIADTSIIMITYIMLAHRFRYEKYVSMGALFRAAQAEDLQKTIDITLRELFLELVKTVCRIFRKDIDELMELIMNDPETAKWVNHLLEISYRQAV